MSTERFRNPGYCHCCRSSTEFVAYSDWLRDTYICGLCHSLPRQRHLQYVLDTYFPGWEKQIIHESSPSNDSLSRYCSGYSSSQYFPDARPGEVIDGIRCENIEALSFDDASIDIFITQDVLEHVFDPGKACKEILRVLKPGGVHLFTTPKHRWLMETRQRAALSPLGEIEHILPAEYHANPVGDGKALVTFDYGTDFEEVVSEWTGRSVETISTLNRSLGLDAEFNEVFMIRREAPPRMEPRPAGKSMRFSSWWQRTFAKAGADA